MTGMYDAIKYNNLLLPAGKGDLDVTTPNEVILWFLFH